MAKFVEIINGLFVNLDAVFCIHLCNDRQDKTYYWRFEGEEMQVRSPSFRNKDEAFVWFNKHIVPHLK